MHRSRDEVISFTKGFEFNLIVYLEHYFDGQAHVTTYYAKSPNEFFNNILGSGKNIQEAADDFLDKLNICCWNKNYHLLCARCRLQYMHLRKY